MAIGLGGFRAPSPIGLGGGRARAAPLFRGLRLGRAAVEQRHPGGSIAEYANPNVAVEVQHPGFGNTATIGGAPIGSRPPGAPPAGQPGGGGGGQAPGQSALDAQYFINTEAENARVNDRINALNQQSAYGRTDLQRALSQLAQKKPLDIENTREKANQQGLLYSGHLGQSLGLLEQSYGDRQALLNQNFARAEAARQGRIASLHNAASLYDQGQRLAAAQRLARLAAGDTSLGAGGDAGVTPTPGSPSPLPPGWSPVLPGGGPPKGGRATAERPARSYARERPARRR